MRVAWLFCLAACSRRELKSTTDPAGTITSTTTEDASAGEGSQELKVIGDSQPGCGLKPWGSGLGLARLPTES